MNKPTQEELFDASYGDDEKFEVVLEKTASLTRHGTIEKIVFKRLSDNTFWQVRYERSTDGDYNQFRSEKVDIVEVEPISVTIIKYKLKK